MDKQQRAEIRAAYKKATPPAGVFIIKNNITGKILLGSSLNLNGPMNRIKFELALGEHKNQPLQDDWNRYGEDNFSFEILDQLEPSDDPAYNLSDELTALEELWLAELAPFGEKGYNDTMFRLRY
jgi:hypothetical protein